MIVTHAQLSAPTGMKKPLANPATVATGGEILTAKPGKAQMIAMSIAIQVWFKAMLITVTCRYTRMSYDW